MSMMIIVRVHHSVVHRREEMRIWNLLGYFGFLQSRQDFRTAVGYVGNDPVLSEGLGKLR